MVGEYNSSITRVRPIFNFLLGTDHTGISWLPKLCQLAANKRPVGSAIKAPEFFGQIRPYTIETREYNDRTLSKRGIEQIELAKIFEMTIPPPNNFLEWLVNNPEKLIQRDTQNPLRKKLFSSDINERNGVKKQALKEIEQYKYNKYGSNKPSNAWWMFEGYSEIDCCFQTSNFVLFIEGKRKETITPGIHWYENRNQLLRNIEVASEYASRGLLPVAGFGVILAVENEADGYVGMSEAMTNLYHSYPHLNSEKADDLLRHLLGFVTWDELINVFDIPKSVVPDKVSDVYPPIEENKIEFPIPASVEGVEREIKYRQIVRCLTAEILFNRGYEEGAYLVLDIGYEGLETEPIFDFISNTYDCMDDFDDIEDLREAVMDVATDVSNYFD